MRPDDWVKIDEDQPPIEDQYLVTDGKSIYIHLWDFLGKLGGVGAKKFGCWRYDGGISDVKVTHWMQLPPLPRRG